MFFGVVGDRKLASLVTIQTSIYFSSIYHIGSDKHFQAGHALVFQPRCGRLRSLSLCLCLGSLSLLLSAPPSPLLLVLFLQEKQTKTLIHPVTFTIKPTKMVAIMGASGAGKSTLLDVLAQRVPSTQASQRHYFRTQPPRCSRFGYLSLCGPLWSTVPQLVFRVHRARYAAASSGAFDSSCAVLLLSPLRIAVRWCLRPSVAAKLLYPCFVT